MSISIDDKAQDIENGSPKEICMRYNHQKSLKIHLTDGTDMEISHDKNAAQMLSELLKSGRAETIHTTCKKIEFFTQRGNLLQNVSMLVLKGNDVQPIPGEQGT